jgi:hypothetical protein
MVEKPLGKCTPGKLRRRKDMNKPKDGPSKDRL